MENQTDKILSPEEDKQFQQELAAAMGLRMLEKLPAELTVTEEPIPDMPRWLG